MKNFFLTAIVLLSFSACETCDCEYVTRESNPTNNYRWTETYRSDWSSTCEDEVLSNSTYTGSNGQKWYTRTEIQCR